MPLHLLTSPPTPSVWQAVRQLPGSISISISTSTSSDLDRSRGARPQSTPHTPTPTHTHTRLGWVMRNFCCLPMERCDGINCEIMSDRRTSCAPHHRPPPPPQSCPTPLTRTTSEDTPALIGRLLRDIVSMRSIMLKTEAVTPRPYPNPNPHQGELLARAPLRRLHRQGLRPVRPYSSPLASRLRPMQPAQKPASTHAPPAPPAPHRSDDENLNPRFLF